jgi:hypothetical protein
VLLVTHSYPAGPRAVARGHKCSKCGEKTTTVTFLLERPRKRNKRGHGAKGIARQVENGILILKNMEP